MSHIGPEPESTQRKLLRESLLDGHGTFGGTGRKSSLLSQDIEKARRGATVCLSHLDNPESRDLRNLLKLHMM